MMILGERTTYETSTQYREWLKDISYKPGWDIQIIGAIEVWLQVTYPAVADSRGDSSPDAVLTVTGHICLPRTLSRKQFYRQVFAYITAMEDHERDEWFRIKGKLVDDPHARRDSGGYR